MMTTLAERIRRLPPRFGTSRLVAIDGPSGAGKTWFAGRLGVALDAPVIHTDHLLDGWDDQFTFWNRLEKQVLGPLRRGEPAEYQRYRWDLGGFGGAPLHIDWSPVILLEGVSAARRAIRDEASLIVFVEAPPELRLRRSIERDGDDSVAYRKYLERWRERETEHFAAEGTAASADVIVDGSGTVEA